MQQLTDRAHAARLERVTQLRTALMERLAQGDDLLLPLQPSQAVPAA